MKIKKTLILFFLLPISLLAQDQKQGTIKVKKEKVDTTVYTIVDQQPQFIGGYSELFRFISRNIVYPDSAKINGISGICYINFVINEDGTVSNEKVLRGVRNCPQCDEEALKVIKMMPDWIPGRQNNKPVKVMYNLPIKFNLK